MASKLLVVLANSFLAGILVGGFGSSVLSAFNLRGEPLGFTMGSSMLGELLMTEGSIHEERKPNAAADQNCGGVPR